MRPARRILLVEGQNDKHVVLALLQRHSVPETFQIEVLEGIDRRIESARVRLKALRTPQDMERIGLIVDADLSRDERWRSLQAALQSAAGVTLPAEPSSGGTIVPLDSGRLFGAWVMPDNRIPGKLEDFLSFLVPSGDVLMPHVDRFLGDLPSRESCQARFADKDLSKARIHAYLAVQDQPGKPMGQALTARYLDPDAPMAADFIDWIRRLFV